MNSDQNQLSTHPKLEQAVPVGLIPRLRSFLRRHGLLIALTGVFMINALDRQILIILLEDIKQEFTAPP